MSAQVKDTPKSCSGILLKKSPSIFKGWQKRFVTVQDKKLKYFSSQDDKMPAGVLNFDHFSCSVNLEAKVITIQMNGNERLFQFKADSPE